MEEDDPWEWRAVWLRGVSALVQGAVPARGGRLRPVPVGGPGRAGPQAGGGGRGRGRGDLAAAAALYQIVVTVDPGYVTAARGLARCRAAAGDVAGALAAYDRIPATHRAHAVAQVEAVRTLVDAGRFVDAAEPAWTPSPSTPAARPSWRPTCSSRPSPPSPPAPLTPARGDRLGGRPVDERGLRRGAEDALRRLARLTPDPAQRTAIVDRANRVRPLTVL